MAKSKDKQTTVPEQDTNAAPSPDVETTPVAETQATPPPAPESEPEPELFSLEELAGTHRVPGWQTAALHRLMGWEPGKKVTGAAYKAGLARLKNRRIGG